MARRVKAQDAVQFVRDRYVKNSPAREAALEGECFIAELAQLIYDLRTAAGLSQQQLAEKIGRPSR